jgi:hypothetical protein
MREIDVFLVQQFSECFRPSEPILEIGSRLLENGTDLRKFFLGKSYFGTDFISGNGVDQLHDASCLGVRTGSIGTVVSVSTIEHVFKISEMFNEVFRVLNPDGAVLVSSHMDFGIHGYPSDYWRFTPEAISLLLGPCKAKIVGYQGLSYQPHCVFGLGFKTMPQDFDDKAQRFRSQLESQVYRMKNGLSVGAKFKRMRQLASFRAFGSRDAYKKTRDEYRLGWHVNT